MFAAGQCCKSLSNSSQPCRQHQYFVYQVLFRPNTVFEITHTLFGDTDIGQFYSFVDNIAMTELLNPADQALDTPRAPGFPGSLRHPSVAGLPPGSSHISVTLPDSLFFSILNVLANADTALMESPQIETRSEGGGTAHVVLLAKPGHEPVNDMLSTEPTHPLIRMENGQRLRTNSPSQSLADLPNPCPLPPEDVLLCGDQVLDSL